MQTLSFNRASATVWTFKTARFRVRLTIEQDYGFRYDGEDASGETQAALDAGELVAFDSSVIVELDGREIARDSLGASIYRASDVAAFWTAHRDANPLNRNSSIMRAACGEHCAIGHYFPDMVREALRAARAALANAPRLRQLAGV